MASLASSLLPLPSFPAFQPRRKNSTKTRSSSLVHKWVILNSLHSSTFPLGSDPPDPQTKFPIVFSYLGALRSPVLNDPLIDVDQDSIQLPFMGGGLCLDPPGKSIDRVFVDDPPWILPNYASNLPNFDHAMSLKSLNSKRMERSKYNELRRRQIKAETEAWARAAEEYKELEREMLEKKLAPSLPYVKSLFLGWFEPLRDAIEAEQRLQTNKRHKAAYAGHIGLLPADKMAVIVMHKMMGLLMMGQEEGCVRVVQAAVHIGEAIEQEVSAAGFWRLA